jgi:hypothetical protein
MHHHFKCKCFQIVAFSCENSPQKRALMVRSSAEIVYISSPRVALGDGVKEKLSWKVNLQILHSGDNRLGHLGTPVLTLVSW